MQQVDIMIKHIEIDDSKLHQKIKQKEIIYGEKDLKKNGAIGSLSLEADRKFSFKHKETKHTVSVILEKGSLLVMKGRTQTNWLHRLPPTKKVKSPRINLTFRTVEI